MSPESRSACKGAFTSLAVALYVAASSPGRSSLTWIALRETATVALDERTPQEACGDITEVHPAALDLLP